MADLTVTAADVRLVKAIDVSNERAGADLAAGKIVRYDANGSVIPARGNNATNATAIGVCIRTAKAGQGVSVARVAYLDMGAAIDGVDHGATVYLSDTDTGGGGNYETSDGTVEVVVGRVVAGHAAGSTTADKLLRLNAAL